MSNDQQLQINADQGTLRTSGDQVEALGVTSMKAGDLLSQVGILGTARNESTGGPPSRITGDTIVQYGGTTMKVSTAASLGLVKQNSDGSYSELSAEEQGQRQQQEQEEQQQQEQGEQSPIPFAPETEAAVTAFVSQIPGTLQDQAISQIIEGGLDNLDLRGAEQIGMGGEDYRGGFQIIMAAMQAQADRHVASKGVEPEAFYQWLREEQPDLMRRAIRMHTYSRNPSAYNGLLDSYMKSTTPSGEALARSNISTTTDRKGERYVTISGVTMLASVAAKIGLI